MNPRPRPLTRAQRRGATGSATTNQTQPLSASSATTKGSITVNTSAIVKTQSARLRRRDNNTGKPRDAHPPSTPTCQRAADETGGTPRPRNHHQPGYRVRRGHLLITGLVVSDRVLTPDPPPNTIVARHQRHAAAFLDDATYLDDIEPVPNPFTGRLLNLTAGPGRGRIDVRHRSGPT